MTLSVRYAARSHRGLLRPNNEDSLYAGPRLLAVADGMGGHVGGNVASRIVIGALAPLDEDSPPGDLLGTLREATISANTALRTAIDSHPDLDGMGTTLTAMLFDGTRIGMVHIGDSRAYLRTEDGTSQISHDDTLVQRLVDEGKLTPEQAAVHPHRSMILHALMGNDDITPDLSIRQARVGDRYLLCSDGVSDYVPEHIVPSLDMEDPADAADRLIELALEAGGRDNISCIVADIVPEGAGTEDPVVAGAVSEPSPVSDVDPESAVLTAVEDAPGPSPKRDRFARRRRRLIVGFSTVLALLVALGGLVAWGRTQYFVKASGDRVAIYRGLNASVAGLHLYRKVSVSDLQVEDLVGTARQSVHDGLSADNRSDAADIIANLADHEQLPPCPTPSGTHSRPRASRTPQPTANKSGSTRSGSTKSGSTNTGNNQTGSQNRGGTRPATGGTQKAPATPSPKPSPTPTPVPGRDCR